MTLTFAVLVQLLAGLVTVTVYDPIAFTVGVAVAPPETIPGPDQLKVAPPVEEEPLNPTEVTVQFNACGAPALALGNAGAV